MSDRRSSSAPTTETITMTLDDALAQLEAEGGSEAATSFAAKIAAMLAMNEREGVVLAGWDRECRRVIRAQAQQKARRDTIPYGEAFVLVVDAWNTNREKSCDRCKLAGVRVAPLPGDPHLTSRDVQAYCSFIAAGTFPSYL